MDANRKPIYKGRIGVELTEADGYAAARAARVEHARDAGGGTRRPRHASGASSASPATSTPGPSSNATRGSSTERPKCSTPCSASEHTRSTMGVTGLPLGMALRDRDTVRGDLTVALVDEGGSVGEPVDRSARRGLRAALLRRPVACARACSRPANRAARRCCFLHGVNGHAETYTRNIGPHAEHFHVFSIDMIGHGSPTSRRSRLRDPHVRPARARFHGHARFRSRVPLGRVARRLGRRAPHDRAPGARREARDEHARRAERRARGDGAASSA